jgi:hypothetical protein
MLEWVLVLTVNLSGQGAEMRDVSASRVPGFASRASCESAAKTLADRLIVVIGHAREQRGIPGGSRVAAPSINYECVEIRK